MNLHLLLFVYVRLLISLHAHLSLLSCPMPPIYALARRDSWSNILNAAEGKPTGPDIGAIVGSILGAAVLAGVAFYIWRKRKRKREQALQVLQTENVDATTLQRQNRDRLRALKSLLPPVSTANEGDWRSKAPSAHPIWAEYRRDFEAQLRAEGYSETAIQLASESGIDDTIFPEESATQVAGRAARVPPGRLQEYITQRIQEEIARQRALGYLAPSSEISAGGSHSHSHIANTMREPSQVVQPTPPPQKPASRFRLPRWVPRGNAKQEEESPQPSQGGKSPQPIELSRMAPTASDRSRETRPQPSTSTERALRPEDYTANDRIRYMVRVASEERRLQGYDQDSDRQSEAGPAEPNFRIYH